LDILTSREWATVIWGLIIFVFVVYKKDVRDSLFKFIRAIFRKNLMVFWIIYVFYVVCITWTISLLSFWDNIFIKDILVWTMFSGIVCYVNAISREADEKYIKKILKNNFKLFIIIEFIVSTFTFNIFVELLIIPAITVLTMLFYFSENKIEFQSVYKFLNIILIVFGFWFIYETIKVGINEYKNLSAVNTLVSFTIPLVYLVLMLPLIYAVELYAKYQLLFAHISYKWKDVNTRRKRQFKILKICKFSVRKLIIFQKEYFPKIYINMTEDEFNNLLTEFRNDKRILSKCK